MKTDHTFSRRSLLTQSAAVAATAAFAGQIEASALSDTEVKLEERRLTARAIRERADHAANAAPFPQHPTNLDEVTLEPKYIGNFTKGLKQRNEFGEVDAAAYEKLIDVLVSKDPERFEEIELAAKPDDNGANPCLHALILEKRIKISADNKRLESPDEFYRTPARRKQLAARAAKSPSAGKMRFGRLHAERGVSETGANQLVDPQAGLAFDLEGFDSRHFVLPPPPSYSRRETVAEIAENYWMAILRDTSYVDLADPTNPLVKEAVDHLNEFNDDFKGPKEEGKVTQRTLFRGNTKAEWEGPYISQFLLRDVPFGAYSMAQIPRNGYLPVLDRQGNCVEPVFLITCPDWFIGQTGVINKEVAYGENNYRYNYRPRDLCNYVHVDELFQAYLNATLILSVGAKLSPLTAPPTTGPATAPATMPCTQPAAMNDGPRPGWKFKDAGGLGAPLNDGNPYKHSFTQVGFGTLGEPNFASLIAEVATRALKAVWYQKWFVHRRLRPEAFAGHIHFANAKVAGAPKYPLHENALADLSKVLTRVNQFNQARLPSPLSNFSTDTYFLPMAFNDGCPVHPSYGAGHATVAGACVTLLKAFYQGQTRFAELELSVKNEAPLPVPIYVPGRNGELIQLTAADGNDRQGTPYSYDGLKDKLTVEGELNKLASNISLARNFAGVHWRSDHAVSLPLGEQVAIEFLKEIKTTYNENVSFNFISFEGTPIVI